MEKVPAFATYVVSSTSIGTKETHPEAYAENYHHNIPLENHNQRILDHSPVNFKRPASRERCPISRHHNTNTNNDSNNNNNNNNRNSSQRSRRPGDLNDLCVALRVEEEELSSQGDLPRSRSRRRLQHKDEKVAYQNEKNVLSFSLSPSPTGAVATHVREPLFDPADSVLTQGSDYALTWETSQAGTPASAGSLTFLASDTETATALAPIPSTADSPWRQRRTPLSRCRRKLLGLRQPAFDLRAVECARLGRRRGGGAAPGDDLDTDVCSAAKCHPLTQVTALLFLGTWRDAADVGLLRARGVTHLLNVAKELGPACKPHAEEGMECHTIPMVDCHQQDLDNLLDEAFGFITKAREANGKVLVYCRRGISRSAAIVTAYLMVTKGLSYTDALDFVLKKRSCVSLNLAFHEKLSEYQENAEWYRKWQKCCCGSMVKVQTTPPQTDSECQEGISLSSTHSFDLKASEGSESNTREEEEDSPFSLLKLSMERSDEDCFVILLDKKNDT